jgi:transcriptional regulator with XRE-family HTH domain|tara:strand:+ start:660 stop:1634 length:975 start_codon:yes stop_codon:yes gene_type:complete
MNLGEKIKKLRTDKGLSQENIYSNQSLVSQIEKGINKNPTEQTLRFIADNLDVPFEELLEDTDWEQPKQTQRKSEFAISQTECVVTIDDSGEIKLKMKSYPFYNDTGNENRFDPDTGYKLLTGCSKCSRSIEKPYQLFCFGCGERLLPEINWNILVRERRYDIYDQEAVDETISPTDRISRSFVTNLSKSLESNKSFVNMCDFRLAELLHFDRLVTDPLISNKYLISELLGESGLLSYDFQSFLFIDFEGSVVDVKGNSVTDESGYTATLKFSDFRDINPRKIENEWIERWWVENRFYISFYKGLLNELLRHQQRLIEEEKEKQ